MPENNTEKRPESTLAAATIDLVGKEENQDYIVCKVGSTAKSLNKYMIVFPVPNVSKLIEDEATLADLETWFKDERNMSLQDVVNQAMRNISYKPDYNGVGFNFEAIPTETADPKDEKKPFVDYPLKANGHEAMQTLADGYKFGQKAPASATQKAKATKLDSLEDRAAAAGTTIEELLAKVEKAKAKSSKK